MHPQPHEIGPTRQQPRDWGSLFNFSESGKGREMAQRLLLSFATTRLHGICNKSNNEIEDGGGGTHSSSTVLDLGISAPTHPKIRSFGVLFGTGRGHKSVLFFTTRLQILKSHHLQARLALTALPVPPRPPFLSAEL